ncbi:MAG: glutamine amidotransferase [Oscillospiraceae bacterium]|nr:glutamine amidotransferase [Oscillospiraceae bacterium]
MELNICHLYPDLLNLYGDRGNVVTLQRRCEARGIAVTVTGAPLGERVHLADFDLLFIGGGQDAEQAILLEEIQGWRGGEIKAAIEDGKVMLAVCGGYQLLGHSYKTWDGREMDLIGALDFYSVGEQDRLIGDYLFEWDAPGTAVSIVGFENHSARTFLGDGVRPFGRVIAGHGNNGKDGTEGARYHNVFGTYSHGPLLPKNPVLADWLIRLALTEKYGSAELIPLDDAFETRANWYMVERLSSGKV